MHVLLHKSDHIHRLLRRQLSKTVALMGLAAGQERQYLAAERRSDKRAAFPGLQNGAVKGMTF